MFLQRAHEHIQNVHENISRAVGGTPLPNNISRAGSQPQPANEQQQQAPPKQEATTTTKAEPPAAKPDAPPSAQPEPAAPKVETVEDAKAESKEVGAVCYEDKPKTDDATAAPVKQEETKPAASEEQPAAAPKEEEAKPAEENPAAPEPEKKEAVPAATQQSEKSEAAKPEAAAPEPQQPEQPAQEDAAKEAPESKPEAPQPEPAKEEPKPEQAPQEAATAVPEQPRALPDAPAPNCSGMRDNTTAPPATEATTSAPEKPVATTEAPKKDEAPAPKEEEAPAPKEEEAPGPKQAEPKRPTREEAKEGLKSYLVGRGYSEEIVNQTVGLFCPVTGKPLCPETGKPLDEKEADKASTEPKEQAKSEETSKDAAPAEPEAPKGSEQAPADTTPEQKEDAPAPEPQQAENQNPPDCTPIAEQKLENSDDTIRKILTQSRTIALVGASATAGRLSNFMMKFMMDRGYHVIPVNPTAAGSTIYDQHVEASVRAIQQPLDMVYVFTNADTTPIVEDAIFVGAKSVWLQAGMVNDKAGEWARAAGLDYVQNVCPRAEIRRLNIPTVSA